MKTQAPIPSRPQLDLPISSAQERLWFLNQFSPGNPAYHLSAAFRLSGHLQESALRESLSEILRRHEILRTNYLAGSGQPVSMVSPFRGLNLPTFDLGELPLAEREAEVHRLALEQSRRPFDLERDLMLRASLVRLAASERVLLVTTHQMAADADSIEIFSRELASLYESFVTGKPSTVPKLPMQYASFASRQRHWLESEGAGKQLAFWKRGLDGIPSLLEFPMGRARPALPTHRGARHRLAFDKPIIDALSSLSQQKQCSLFAILLAAFQTLVSRYTGCTDIAIGSTASVRTQPGSEGMIGNFSNLLVLRTDLAGDPSFLESVKRVEAVLTEARIHGEFPFERLLEELRPPRDPSYPPLVQVTFDLKERPSPSHASANLIISPFEVDCEVTGSDLALRLEQTSHGLEGWIQYATDLFDAASIARMAGHLEKVLEEVSQLPNQRLSGFTLLTTAEREQLVVEWNQTRTDFPANECLHHLFETQATQAPESIALISEREQLTYRELNERADELANHLRQLGVGPEVLVAVCAERSVEMIIGMLAILKAGGAYVPLDPAYPPERLGFILQDAKTPVLLTQQRLRPRLPHHNATLVLLDEPTLWAEMCRNSQKHSPHEVTSKNLAYVIYTSGSTGQPKGVAIEHHSPVAFVHWAKGVFSAEELAGVLASTSICFDLSIFEIFVPLSSGGKVILAKNALHLPTLPAANQVTLINTVPSAITELARTRSIPPSVRTVNLAGEPLEPGLVREIYKQSSVTKVYDLYGPSETTTYSTFALRSPNGPATIGRPISNTQIYLLDELRQLVPQGVPGELYLGGAGLARGYLNQPALTAEKFIPNPFDHETNSRLYKTGDLARYMADGNIEFLGRRDNQVKLRGFRVELGEIEAVLRQHPSVGAAAVIAREDVPGDKRLVAYVVAARAGSEKAANLEEAFVPELRAWLKNKVPDYMVPASFVSLSSLPLTPNGKLDRKALPPPDQIRPVLKETFVAPRTATEEMLAEIWGEVLNLKQVGVHDHFFELGGHSLMIIQVISRLRETVQVELSMQEFFANPTIAGLAQLVEATLVREISQLTEDEAQSLAEGATLLHEKTT